MRIALVVGALTLASLTANAQTSIGPFTGTDSDNFSSQSGTAQPCVPGRILNNQGDICTPAGSGIYMTGGWGYACSLPAYSSPKMCGCGSAGGGGIDITFDAPVSRFGGYFGMNHTGAPDFTVSFFAGTTPVGNPILIKQACDCIWYWYGWDFGTTGIDRVHLVSNHSSTGYLHMDDLEVDWAPSCTIPYGTGCAGAGGFVPELSGGCAIKGQPVQVDIMKGLGGSLSGLMIAASQVNVPIGPTTCTLYVGSPSFLVFLPLGGSGAGNGAVTLNAVVPLGVPSVTVYLQAFIADPAGPIGLSATNGLAMQVQ